MKDGRLAKEAKLKILGNLKFHEKEIGVVEMGPAATSPCCV